MIFMNRIDSLLNAVFFQQQSDNVTEVLKLIDSWYKDTAQMQVITTQWM